MDDDRKWERYGALGGIGFVVVLLVATFMIPPPPATNATAAKFGAYFRDHQGAAAAASYVQGIATIGILFWAGALWRAMRRAEGGDPFFAVVAFGGLVVGGAMASAAGAVNATTALRIDELGDAGAKTFATLSLAFFAMGALALAAHVAAVSALALRSRFLPRWVAQLGALVAALWVAGGLALTSDASGYGLVAFVAFLAWLLWVACVGVVLSRDGVAQVSTEPPDNEDEPAIAAEPPSEQSGPEAPSLP